MAQKAKIGDLRKEFNETNNLQDKLLELQKEEINNISDIYNMKKKLLTAQTEYNSEQQKLNNIIDTYNSKIKDGYTTTKQTKDALDKELKAQQNLVDTADKKLKTQQKINNALSVMKLNYDAIGKGVTSIYKYLQDSDKIIRQTTLQLGLSGQKADMMRSSFEDSAGFAARMGLNLGDIQTIMTTFADETGRAKVLTSAMLNDFISMSTSTGLNVEEATRLGGQLELMGLNARASKEYFENIVISSEKLGVNTAQVLKNISGNFKQLEKFTFQSGVKGIQKMAEYSAKFKMDMSQTLDSAQAARGLEGVIGMMANLQVMGGEFAKADPFEMLYLSRNAPEEYAKKINEMTKGIAGFRKLSDGTFQKFISPQDMDRLESVSKTLGIDKTQLVEQSYRMAEIQKMRQQMIASPLTNPQKEIVEGLADFNTKTGKFTVQIANGVKDISQITAQDIKALEMQKTSLDKRAVSAQTFETALKATMDDFKAAFLPFLKGINSILDAIRPIVMHLGEAFNNLTKSTGPWTKIALGIGVLGTAKVLMPLASILKNNITNRITPNFIKNARTSSIGKGAVSRGGGIGGSISGLATGAGVGLAGVGMGEGINLAAEGISKLADSMSKLNKDQIHALTIIGTTLAITFPLAAIGVLALGGASEAVAPGLIALGATIALIGVGIGAAAAGIGMMGNGLANLVNAGKDSGTSLLKVAAGIGAIQLAMAGGGIATILTGGAGVMAFTATMNNLSKNAPALANVGDAFKSIGTVLTGSKDQFANINNMINAINTMDNKKLSPLADLANMLKQPLKVEFANKEIAIVSNITLNMDGNKVASSINIGGTGMIQLDGQRTGKTPPKTINKYG